MYHSEPQRKGEDPPQPRRPSGPWRSCTSSMSLQDQRTWDSGTLREGIAQSKVANQTVKHRTPLRPLLPAASAPSGVTLHKCSTRTLPTMKQLQHIGTKIKTSALLGPRTQHHLKPLPSTAKGGVLQLKKKRRHTANTSASFPAGLWTLPRSVHSTRSESTSGCQGSRTPLAHMLWVLCCQLAGFRIAQETHLWVSV